MQDCNCGRFLFQVRAGEYELASDRIKACKSSFFVSLENTVTFRF